MPRNHCRRSRANSRRARARSTVRPGSDEPSDDRSVVASSPDWRRAATHRPTATTERPRFATCGNTGDLSASRTVFVDESVLLRVFYVCILNRSSPHQIRTGGTPVERGEPAVEAAGLSAEPGDLACLEVDGVVAVPTLHHLVVEPINPSCCRGDPRSRHSTSAHSVGTAVVAEPCPQYARGSKVSYFDIIESCCDFASTCEPTGARALTRGSTRSRGRRDEPPDGSRPVGAATHPARRGSRGRS